MRYTPKQYAEALSELLTEAPAEKRTGLIRNFSLLIKRHRAERLVPQIAAITDKLLDKDRGREPLTILTAKEETAASVSRTISGQGEQKILLQPDLIGGVKITRDEWRVDSSLQNRIKILRNSI